MVNEFKVGDAVKLKIGGPKMVVREVRGVLHDSVHCQWFAGTKLKMFLSSGYLSASGEGR